jgi:aromatic ring-opening dioxygenase catalytic subunit (LigB family)
LQHWEEREFTVDYQTGPTKLLYDYGGFPTEAYAPHLTYPVPTDASLAQHVHQLLTAQGVKNTIRPRGDGFDHGVFIPLTLAFPEATIPVVQVSVNRNLDIASHIKLGEALAPLRKEGVLIIGSGQITHNMGASRSASGKVDPRAIEFTDHFKALLEGTTESNYEERKQALIASPALAPHFDYEHPRTEHFIPLVVAFGAARPSTVEGSEVLAGESCAAAAGALQVRRLFHHVAMGSMATDAYIFTLN